MKNHSSFFLSGIALLLVLMGLLLVVNGRCSSLKTDKNAFHITFQNNRVIYTKWNEIFEQDTVIPLCFNEPSQEIFTISELCVIQDGGYIIADGKAKKMMQFDSTGKFVRFIGGVGAGPGELSMGCGRPYIDNSKNLYLADVFTHRINKYNPPDYRFEKFFIIPYDLQKYIIDPYENFIIYTISDPSVLQKITASGKTLKKTFQINHFTFRLFSARFQIGGFEEVPGKGFLFSYPEAYRIYFFDYNFNLKKIFSPSHYSRFFPKDAEFPNTLSPYDFTPAHARWWGSQLRTAGTFYLENGFFIQELLLYTNMTSISFFNLHDLTGMTYAVGIEAPFEGGFIKFAKNGYVYVVEESIFDYSGKTTPIRLHRYRFKKSINALNLLISNLK